ncbi:MAG TPA: universal stress protein [Burkholderiales bacterium]|jgi:nucleotide-binding universal stress UspA family protein|nr:universal stress protein [Burkholderiales bacterium]
MYKNLLVPTDGSKLSDRAVKEAIGLARALGARVTFYYATSGYPDPIYAESAMMATYIPPEQYSEQTEKFAAKVLAKAAAKVSAAGLKADTYQSVADVPYEGIIAAAVKKKCDLIIMASHGRRGVSGFLLGSETQKVLTHSKVPVLVVR